MRLTLADTKTHRGGVISPWEHLVFVLIGKASEIEGVVQKYGKTMKKKPITDVGF